MSGSNHRRLGWVEDDATSSNGSGPASIPETVIHNYSLTGTLNALPRFNSVKGNSVINSGVLIDASNNVSGVATLSASTLTASTVSASTSISSPSIITSSGNLSLNPSGASISMNSKNLTSIGTITPTTANNAGDILIMGNTTPLLSTTPNAINLGTGISSVAGSNLKLKIYDDGLNRLGFGMSNTQLDYVCTSGADSHVFYNGGAERARINQSALRVAVPITTSAGDLSLNPSGSNININSKNLSNVGTGITASAGLTISTSSNAALNLTANGSGNVVIGSTTGSIQLNRPITNASGDLTLNPTGSNIAFSNKTLSNAYRIVLNGSTTTLGTHKLRLYDDGSNFYGLGVQNGVLSYELPAGTASHVFYHNAIEQVRINNTALQTTVPITTSSGDLTLNPSGSNIVCSSKNLTSVNQINIPTVATTNYNAITFSAGAVNTGTGSGPRINLGSSFSNVGDEPNTLKLLLAGGYGLGVGGSSLNSIVPSGSSFRWYSTNAAGTAALLQLNSTNGLQLGASTQIRTVSGDLVLNPTGSNINFSNKLFINATTNTTTNLTDTNWTGTLTITTYRIGQLLYARFSGNITPNTSVSMFTGSTSLSTALRPLTTTTYNCFVFGVNAQIQRFLVDSTGVVSISRQGGGNFGSGDSLYFDDANIYMVWAIA